MTDPIADLLTRIRNGLRARHESLNVPYSKLKEGIVKTLHEEGFIGPWTMEEDQEGKKVIHLSLRYTSSREPLIAAIIRMSRPGRRLYLGYGQIRPIRNGIGVAILSTPKGILTDRQAREERVGGELLCAVW